eukprot:2311698-Alexandrium_andersonii.AAC.1
MWSHVAVRFSAVHCNMVRPDEMPMPTENIPITGRWTICLRAGTSQQPSGCAGHLNWLATHAPKAAQASASP